MDILADATALLGSERSFIFLIDNYGVKPSLHQAHLAAKHGHLSILKLLHDSYSIKLDHKTLLWSIRRKRTAVTKYLVYEKKVPLYYPGRILIPVNGVRWNAKYRYGRGWAEAGEFRNINNVILTEIKELEDSRDKREILMHYLQERQLFR